MKDLKDLGKHIDDVKVKIRMEEEVQAKWQDVDQDEQDLEIKALDDISSFEQEEANIKHQIQSKRHDIESIMSSVEELRDAAKSVEERKAEAEGRKKQIQDETKKAEKNLEALSGEISKRHGEKEKNQKLIEHCETKAGELTDKTKTLEKEVQEFDTQLRQQVDELNWQGCYSCVRLHAYFSGWARRVPILELLGRSSAHADTRILDLFHYILTILAVQ